MASKKKPKATPQYTDYPPDAPDRNNFPPQFSDEAPTSYSDGSRSKNIKNGSPSDR